LPETSSFSKRKGNFPFFLFFRILSVRLAFKMYLIEVTSCCYFSILLYYYHLILINDSSLSNHTTSLMHAQNKTWYHHFILYNVLQFLVHKWKKMICIILLLPNHLSWW
jgi:hypothetical protein